MPAAAGSPGCGPTSCGVLAPHTGLSGAFPTLPYWLEYLLCAGHRAKLAGIIQAEEEISVLNHNRVEETEHTEIEGPF